MVVPYRLAFVDEDSTKWVIVYLIVDCQFLIDMILTFFTALEDNETQEVITDKKKIAKNYL